MRYVYIRTHKNIYDRLIDSMQMKLIAAVLQTSFESFKNYISPTNFIGYSINVVMLTSFEINI